MVRVKHPNVVELLSWGTVDDGRPYLAMELLAGTDLARFISKSGRLAPERALAILDAIAPYRLSDGGYRLENTFTYLMAQA